jgi:hypothetical protein
MKKLLPILMLLALFFSQACEGPEGPAGAPGPAGPQGPAGAPGATGPAGTPATSSVYEFNNWDFTAADNFALELDFALNEIEVSESDAILVYRLWDQLEDGTPIWRMLPQLIFFPVENSNQKVTLQYDFVHTQQLLAIIMSGSVDLATLGAGWTTDQVFRIVVIPGTFAQRTDGTKKKINLADYNVDYNNYEAVIKYFRLSDKNVRRLNRK